MKANEVYLYYAIFDSDIDGINVRFPDLEGAFTTGEAIHEALYSIW